jgi:hypothetical protein
MPRLSEFRLDQRGLDFMRASLDVDTALCRALSTIIRECPGETFTLAPEESPPSVVYGFSGGGLLPENRDMSRAIQLEDGGRILEVKSLQAERARRIHAQLQAQEHACCIIDEVTLTADDAGAGLEPSAFFIGKAIYHLLTGADSVDMIESVLFDTNALWHQIAAVCVPPVALRPADLSNAEAIQACLSAVIEVTTISHDGEGFVVWRRASS